MNTKKESKEETKKIPPRNYIIFCLLVVATIFLTLSFRNWYNLNKDLNKEKTIMSEFLVSVNEKEFENYIMENNNVIIYLASSSDESLKDFEEKFKEMLINYNLQEQIIFIDLKQINDDFFENLKNNYLSDNLKNISLDKFNNIMIMENGKVNAILYNKKTPMNIDDIKELFYNRGVIGQA